MIVGKRFRILDPRPADTMGERRLARGHDLSTWRECAILILHTDDPNTWQAAARQVLTDPQLGNVAIASDWTFEPFIGASMGWVALEVQRPLECHISLSAEAWLNELRSALGFKQVANGS